MSLGSLQFPISSNPFADQRLGPQIVSAMPQVGRSDLDPNLSMCRHRLCKTSPPRVVACDNYVILEFQHPTGPDISVYVDDLTTAQRLTSFGTWRPDPPRKPRLLRHSCRSGRRSTTIYAHEFLFRETEATAERERCYGRRRKLKPKDGNYFNLRAANFLNRPRTPSEVSQTLSWLGPIWDGLRTKAFRALRDRIEADDALDSMLKRVIETLEAGDGSFSCPEKFHAWSYTVLEGQLRLRLSCRRAGGDVVRDNGEHHRIPFSIDDPRYEEVVGRLSDEAPDNVCATAIPTSACFESRKNTRTKSLLFSID